MNNETTTQSTASAPAISTAGLMGLVAQDPAALKILEGTVTRIVDARLEDEKWRRRFALIATFGVAYISGVIVENRRPKTAKERVRILFTGK